MTIKNHILKGLNIAVVLLFVSAFFIRCASIMTPDGGPYDTLPPVIVDMSPDNFTTNFTSKKIYIEFDEFVKLTDQSKEFFTSPQMKTKPRLTTRGRGVVVTLGDSLEPNTTYALNFGTTIRDNNEGNPLYSMRYVFSTGNEIDSMVMSGYAEDSFSSDSVSGAMIYFFIADSVELNADYDSVMFNNTPAVIARAESNGIFLAQNLKPIDYLVYAYEDRNNNFMYEPETDQIAFVDGVYNPAKMPDFSLWLDSLRGYVVAEPQLHFKLFQDVAFKRQNMQSTERPLRHKAMLYFNAPYPQIEQIRFDSIAEGDFIVEPLTKGRDTLAVWFNVDAHMLPDTIRGEVTYFKHDSVRNLVESTDPLRLAWRFIETKEQIKEREELERERIRAEEEGEEWVAPVVANTFKMSVTSSTGGIVPDQPLIIDFDYPLTHIDTSAISITYFSVDSVQVKQRVDVERDSVNMRRWYLRSKFDQLEGFYQLSIPDSTFANVAREVNDSLGTNYSLKNPEEFATINVKFTKPVDDNADYIIQMLQGSTVLNTTTMTKSGEYTVKYIPASDVSFRVIQDANGDGERSSGNLVERLFPERVATYQKDGESAFAMKVNWEFDFELKVEELFIEESMEALIKRLDEEEMQRLKKLAEEAKSGNNSSKNNSRR